MISAGTPIAAVGEQDNPFAGETLSLTRDLVPDTANIYALQVKGDSMIDALVHDGDWVIIKYQNTAERGDMVVAWITDREETTLKYYHRKERRSACSRPTRPMNRSMSRPNG